MMDAMWWTLGAVLWLVCGVLAYGIEFAWHVGLCESYSLAGNNDEMLRDGQIAGAIVGMFGPIGLIMAVGATRVVRLPRQSQWVRWRSPEKAWAVIRAFQQVPDDCPH